ncbi:Cyclic di-GMP phosphodiesterase Gmr [Acaryochloris thomasi RCC1774]|uniref:Cyclic di-GMP phosphodiesterase Gmr n=1 Tax=Acaryochloris thomasi RCC1774 TaxID=1764569 RepID=A0A2W1JYZ0_9CYAN|nr:GGDEF domain-containing response regulator [Acaryochloris thomasi]PZD73711.1 Cyclic di-GMP phosphodiesterase Gmr [Acaryochloris thomasi RCC1774]
MEVMNSVQESKACALSAESTNADQLPFSVLNIGPVDSERPSLQSPTPESLSTDSTGSTQQGRILIVDDRPDNLRLLHSMLTQAGYDVRRAINGSTALMGIRAILPDLILLDINMPDMNGYEVCQELKQDSQTREIPIIFLSALDEGLDKVKAFSAGGVDYVTKPFEVMEVLARIENHLQLQRAKAEVEQLNSKLEQRVTERTAELQATKHDLEQEVMERRQAQERLAHMAWHDHLTDLPNRAWFMKVLQQSIKRAQQEENYAFAVLFLDCDRFKVINDSLGHLIGDQLLIQVAKRLANVIPENVTLARFGGDEFTLLLDEIPGLEAATDVGQQLLEELTQSFQLGQQEIFISASVGIAMGSRAYDLPEALLRDADIAMYRAKTLGKACYQVFDTAMHQHAQTQLRLETDLRRAIERQEFLVNYQPIISLTTLEITGFEALVRWHHPQRGLVSPGQFIPIAEETSLIVPIGLWVLKESCQQLVTWQQMLGGETVPTLKMSVNLSVKQFSQPDLIDRIDQFLEQMELQGHLLTLEITESALMDNPEAASQVLTALRDRNIQLAIDDFGTGYSSLSYLHRFPVDILKVDRSFINRIEDQDNGLRIVEATLAMAHSLGMQVVAEGVETQAQALQLQQLGCEYAQGYLFSKPLAAETAAGVLAQPPAFSDLLSRR